MRVDSLLLASFLHRCHIHVPLDHFLCFVLRHLLPLSLGHSRHHGHLSPGFHALDVLYIRVVAPVLLTNLVEDRTQNLDSLRPLKPPFEIDGSIVEELLAHKGIAVTPQLRGLFDLVLAQVEKDKEEV